MNRCKWSTSFADFFSRVFRPFCLTRQSSHLECHERDIYLPLRSYNLFLCLTWFIVERKKCDWLNYSCQPNSLLFRNCFSCAKIEKLFSEEIGNSLEQKHMHPKYCCTAPCQCECVLCFVLFRPKADWKENTLPAKRKSSKGYYYMVIQFLASIVCT